MQKMFKSPTRGQLMTFHPPYRYRPQKCDVTPPAPCGYWFLIRVGVSALPSYYTGPGVVLQQLSEKGLILGVTSTGKGTGSIIHQVKAQNLWIMELADAIVNALDLWSYKAFPKKSEKIHVNIE